MRALLRCLAALGLLSAGCVRQGVPDPAATVEAYARAARAGDEAALYELLTERSQKELGREGVRRAVADARAELGDQSMAITKETAETKQTAKLRFADGEVAILGLEGGAFRIASADALPAGARTPAQALEQLRRVLARRSYAGLMRVLSKETRSAIERDLRGLVEGLEHPDALEIKVSGDQATVQTAGGHVVRLRREGTSWVVDDFD